MVTLTSGCIAKSLKTLSSTFDGVESKVTSLIQKLSRHEDGVTFVDGQKVVALSDAPVKDHLHVYSQVQTAPHLLAES
jgi:hypothetical protein